MMKEQTIKLGEREDKTVVKILVIIFGIMCIITAGWWTVFLIRYPENENIFWAGSIFLLLFGFYQLYSGLGFARRYIRRSNELLFIRQNSFLPVREIKASELEKLEMRPMDMVFHIKGNKRFRLKLGLKYPDLGERIKDFITDFAGDNNIEIFYKNEAL